jgi:hypothetical protein
MSQSDSSDGLMGWYHVRFDESGITRDVRPSPRWLWASNPN